MHVTGKLFREKKYVCKKYVYVYCLDYDLYFEENPFKIHIIAIQKCHSHSIIDKQFTSGPKMTNLLVSHTSYNHK